MKINEKLSLCLCLSPLPVPDQVSELSMSALEDGPSLRVSWVPPRGHWDHYRLLLWNASLVLVNQTLGVMTTQYIFSGAELGLVLGRIYRAEVTVQSGLLGNMASCQGRLGKWIEGSCTWHMPHSHHNV